MSTMPTSQVRRCPPPPPPPGLCQEVGNDVCRQRRVGFLLQARSRTWCAPALRTSGRSTGAITWRAALCLQLSPSAGWQLAPCRQTMSSSACLFAMQIIRSHGSISE